MSEEIKHPELPDNRNLIEIAQKKRMVFLLQKLHQRSLSPTEIKELKQLEGPSLPPGCVRTQEELSRAFCVSARTIRYWVQDGMPREPEGYYNLIEIMAWRAVKNAKDKTPDEQTKIKWDIMAKEYRALLYKLEYQKALGELISRSEVKAGNNARVLAVRRNFLAIPKHIALSLEGKKAREIETLLTEVLEDICNQFGSQEDVSEVKSHETGQDNLESGRERIVESPAENNSQPVE